MKKGRKQKPNLLNPSSDGPNLYQSNNLALLILSAADQAREAAQANYRAETTNKDKKQNPNRCHNQPSKQAFSHTQKQKEQSITETNIYNREEHKTLNSKNFPKFKIYFENHN